MSGLRAWGEGDFGSKVQVFEGFAVDSLGIFSGLGS